MSRSASYSSACRSGHHKDCSGHRKTGKKRKKCACPCHEEARKLEADLKARGFLDHANKVVVRDSPAFEKLQQLAHDHPEEVGAAIADQARKIMEDSKKLELATRPQPIYRHGFPQITPRPSDSSLEEAAREFSGISPELGTNSGGPATNDRPACFGSFADMSSTCDACPDFNACRRASS